MKLRKYLVLSFFFYDHISFISGKYKKQEIKSFCFFPGDWNGETALPLWLLRME